MSIKILLALSRNVHQTVYDLSGRTFFAYEFFSYLSGDSHLIKPSIPVAMTNDLIHRSMIISIGQDSISSTFKPSNLQTLYEIPHLGSGLRFASPSDLLT